MIARTIAGCRLGALLLLVSAATAASAERNGDWWEAFGDPALSALIVEGMAANPSLSAARGRIEQADAVALQSIAPALPKLSVDLSGRIASIESLGLQAAPGQSLPDTYSTYSAKVNVVLAVDVWGGTILAHRAARREALASRSDAVRREDALAARIAEAYYDVVGGRLQVRVVETQIETSRTLLELVQLRYERGAATGLDVLQQRQQLAGITTLLPPTEAFERSARQQLAILLGRPPTERIEVPASELPLPDAPVPLADSSVLVEDRADLLAARERLAAAKSRRISAVSGFLPSLSVSGGAGEEGIEIDQMEKEFVWQVGAGISIPLFSGGRNLGAYRQARAAERIAERDLRTLTLQAQQEVESALVQERRYRGQVRAYRDQLEAAADALDQSKARYFAGLTDYQSVLTALNIRQQSELNLIDSHRGLVASRIRLHEAVGGALEPAAESGDKEAVQ